MDKELLAELSDKFEEDIIRSIFTQVKKFQNVKPDAQLFQRIKYVTSEAFNCGYWTEDNYFIALYGAICPNAGFEDFKYYLNRKIPYIENFFNARHGLDDFVGKYVVTTQDHSAYDKIPKGTVVQIIGVSYRGYDIETEDGRRVLEIGYII